MGGAGDDVTDSSAGVVAFLLPLPLLPLPFGGIILGAWDSELEVLVYVCC